jgi:hypothetical protein
MGLAGQQQWSIIDNRQPSVDDAAACDLPLIVVELLPRPC